MGEDASFPIIGQPNRNPSGAGESYQLVEAAILLSPNDNVVVARRGLLREATIAFGGKRFILRDSIQPGHKFALRDIPQGSPVIKYAQPIGKALYPIEAGEWVHTHNVEAVHDVTDFEYAAVRCAPPELSSELPRTFLGYRRSDGRVGTRNYLIVAATGSCSSHVCQQIAGQFRDFRSGAIDGIVALPHSEGCGHHEGPDMDQMRRTLQGILLNPNVAAALIVGLGCEVNSLSYYSGARLCDTKPIIPLEIQSIGGTLKTIAEGELRVRELMGVVDRHVRSEQPASEILLGLNCGGSDAFSGITANPALGFASDLLISAGGTAVLAETPEIYGAEQLLTRRAIDIETGKRLVYIIKRYQEYVGRFGATMDSNPAPGNKRGGITNIVEKSLGAVMKAGNTMLSAVVDYAEQVTKKGLVVMDTPGYDPVSLTGIAAGGCNIISFTTGRGSAIGFPIVPVLKIASNSRTFQVMNDNMDVNAGEIVDGTCTVQEKGIEIYQRVLKIASGEQTKSEILGHKEFAPWRIGPVM